MQAIDLFSHTLQQRAIQAPLVTDRDYVQRLALQALTPQQSVAPTTTLAVAEVVQVAGQNGLTLLASGNGSQMALGNLPTRQPDLLVRTTSLNRLLEYEAPDLTCHVEAGMTLAELQTRLQAQGQWLALDPPDAEYNTLGGILATNSSGPKRFKYGTARDLVIGLRVVQANGEITRSGGRVVKNVAGYDLNKLYIGSLGTLGIITEINFKLHPLPAQERTVLFTHTSIHYLMAVVSYLLRSALAPAALAISSHLEPTVPTTYTLGVNLEGYPSVLIRQVDELLKVARAESIHTVETLEGQEQAAWWHTLRTRMRGRLTCRVTLQVSQLANYIHFAEILCHRYNLNVSFVGHAGSGMLYIELSQTPETLTAITELRTRAQARGGSLIIERCPATLKAYIDIWGEPRADFFLMQKLKTQFDPQALFVQGRFLGGL